MAEGRLYRASMTTIGVHGRLYRASMSVATVTAGTDQTGIENGATVTLTATSSTGSVVWSQVSGPTVTLSQSGLTATFTAPGRFAFTTAVFQATASGSSATVSVSFLPATAGIYKTVDGVLTLLPAEISTITITDPTGFGQGGFGEGGFGQ